jgi:hypothetical protein
MDYVAMVTDPVGGNTSFFVCDTDKTPDDLRADIAEEFEVDTVGVNILPYIGGLRMPSDYPSA